MKNIILSTISIIIFYFYSFAQVPQAFNYQAVVRDNNGNELANQKVSFRISIIQGSITGTTVYGETHIDSTNQFGLVTLEIGNGVVVSDDFSTIEWSTGTYFLKVEMDETGGTSYQEMGTTQLLSVPYALYAKGVEDKDDDDANPTNELQELSFSNDTLFISLGNYIELPYSSDLKLSFNKINSTCYSGSNGSIDINVSGGFPPYSYLWSNGDTLQYINNLSAGNYTIVVTDNKWATLSQTITISEPQPLTLNYTKSDVSCYGSSDGNITLIVSGGTPSYYYDWSNGATTQSIYSLYSGQYNVKVIDANNCEIYDTIQINQPDSIKITYVLTNIDCYGDNSGAIDINVTGGTSPYTYYWSNSKITEDIDNITAEQYNVTVTDSNNCVKIKSISISQNDDISILFTTSNVSCYGGSDGSIELTVTGGISPYSYSWNNGATTKDIADLSTGYYAVIVTDSKSCEKADSVLISEQDLITITIKKIIDEFKTTSDGSIDISVSGGTPPYSYNWSNAAITEDIDNLTSATYTVEVTDSKSCTKQKDILINRLDSITDIDGNKYDIVKIGEQVWTAENLKTTKYNDGWEIVNIMAPGNDEDSIPVYGRLYTWYVIDGGKMCPEGWHVPTDSDWSILVDSLRGPELAGGSLKESGTEHWFSPNSGATNQSGFTALPAGQGGSDLGYYAYFWSSTIYGNYTYYRRLSRTNTEVERSSGSKDYYLSVRCIKD